MQNSQDQHKKEHPSTYFVQDRQKTKTYPLVYRAGTPEGQAYYEDMKRALSTLRPFIQKWGSTIKNFDYDATCQQALNEMQQSDFSATWNLLTAWGTK